jgi:hypothetical protein
VRVLGSCLIEQTCIDQGFRQSSRHLTRADHEHALAQTTPSAALALGGREGAGGHR